MSNLTNPYQTESHRQAFGLAVELLQTGLDRFEVSKQLDKEMPREMRRKITAKAARMLGQYAKSPSGTKPNTSVVLSEIELNFVLEHYHGRKSVAIHEGLKRLQETDIAEPSSADERDALVMWQRATPKQKLQVLIEMRRLGLLLSGKVAPWESEHFY